MILIPCVGFASIDVVCDEPNDCVLSDKRVYVYCVKSFAYIECYSDCSRRGVIWLNPFATVLFTVCSAVTLEYYVLHPCCVGVFGMFTVM